MAGNLTADDAFALLGLRCAAVEDLAPRSVAFFPLKVIREYASRRSVPSLTCRGTPTALTGIDPRRRGVS